MERCCKRLNEIFDIDGPDFIEIDTCNVEFNGLFAHGFRGKKHTEESKRLIQQASVGENVLLNLVMLVPVTPWPRPLF